MKPCYKWNELQIPNERCLKVVHIAYATGQAMLAMSELPIIHRKQYYYAYFVMLGYSLGISLPDLELLS